MNRHSRLIISAAGVFAFAVIVFLFLGSKSADPLGKEVQTSGAPSNEEEVGSQVLDVRKREVDPEGHGRNRESSAEVLPDPTVPLANQIPILIEEAQRGNTVAVCRLTISVNRCKETYRSARLTVEMQSALEARVGDNDDAVVELIARSVERGEESAVFCQGVDEDDLPDVSSLIESALHSFNVRQKVILALTQVDGSLRRIRRPSFQSLSGLYVLPQFQSDYALEFLLEGFRSRDPLALEGLVLVYAPGRTFAPHGPAIWLPNPREFLFYATLMHQVFGAESLGESGLRLAYYSTLVLSKDEARMQVDRAIIESKRWLGTGEEPFQSLDEAIAEFEVYDGKAEPSC